MGIEAQSWTADLVHTTLDEDEASLPRAALAFRQRPWTFMTYCASRPAKAVPSHGTRPIAPPSCDGRVSGSRRRVRAGA